jgi:hypothetical protein
MDRRDEDGLHSIVTRRSCAGRQGRGDHGVSADYRQLLDELLGVFMHVRFTTYRRDVVDYAVVLLIEGQGDAETVRLYDGAHGTNEMHRYTRSGGKQLAEVFHRDALGPAMRAAIEQIVYGYEAMIESWLKQ